MRSIVEATVKVYVPVGVAYNQWTEFESFPDFLTGVDAVEQVDDTLTRWTVSVGGVVREFDAHTIEMVPDHHITWLSVDGIAHTGRVDFEPLGDDLTQVTVSLEWEPENFVEKAGAVLQLDTAQIQSDLNKFKEIVEAEGIESGAWRGTIDSAGNTFL